MDKRLLTVMTWLLFIGGHFGFALGLLKTFQGASSADYGIMGIGGDHSQKFDD